MHAYGRRDRHAKLFGTFRDCMNVPKGPMFVAVYGMVFAYILL